jgi:type 1 fimbria pilin
MLFPAPTPFSRKKRFISGITIFLLVSPSVYAAANSDTANLPSQTVTQCTAAQFNTYDDAIRFTLQKKRSQNLDEALQRLQSAASSMGNCALRAKLYIEIGLV